MTPEPQHSRAHHGPHAVFTQAELRRIHAALLHRDDDEAQAIKAKIGAAITSDPRFLLPHN